MLHAPRVAPKATGDTVAAPLPHAGCTIDLASDDSAPCVTTTVTVAAPAAELFALVTNARQWSRWHPATTAVRDTPDRPLVEGDSVVESIRAAGRSFDARWVVVECDTPRRWVIATDSPQGRAWIEYALVAEPGGTRFTRRLRWRSHTAPWTWCDRWLTRWILARQSRRALMNLASLFRAR
jgi:uncharacterized protein YndB with AHSA1/START domain